MSQTLTVQAMQRLEQYSNALAKAYGIPVNALAKQFSVTGPVETGLRAALLASVEFLGLITCLDVDQIKGQVVQVASASCSPAARRTAASTARSASMATPTS
ncbi:hypothetical protein WP2W18C05_23820 [Aeromonas sp. WP2-W18-CRE-05]|nr:hypothetical protein WP2W18C05_23820 [Aeromonas sp. WP2-W18-CRE-05]